MDLVEPEKKDLEESEPRRVTEVRPNNQPAGLAWLRALSMILVAIILVVLIVLFARWVYHKAHHSDIQTKPATSQQQSGASSSSTEQGQSSGGSSSNNSSSSSPTNTNNTPPSSGNTPNQLPNNGPGNVAAVFVGTSLAAAGLHYVITSRRDVKYQA